jgi:hypothetical protein
MRSQVLMGTTLLTLIFAGQGLGGEVGQSDEMPRRHLFERIRPAGGWNPYGGGVLHWWNRDCFPCVAAPDDYCKKQIPRVCWPSCYPSYYRWGPTEIGPYSSDGFGNCVKPH